MEEKDKALNAESSTLPRPTPEGATIRLTRKKRLLDEANQDSRDSPVEQRKCLNGASSNLAEAESVVNLFRPSTPLSVGSTAETDLIDLTQSDNDEEGTSEPLTNNGVQLLGCSYNETARDAAAGQTANGSVQSGDLGTSSVETSSVGVSTSTSTLDPTDGTLSTNSGSNCGAQVRESLVHNSVHSSCMFCSRPATHPIGYLPIYHCAVHHPLNIRYMNVHHFHQHFHGEPAITYPMSNANYAGASSDPLHVMGVSFPFHRAPVRTAQTMTPLTFPSYFSRNTPHAFRPRNSSTSVTTPSCRGHSCSAHTITAPQPATPLSSPRSRSDAADQRSPVSPTSDETSGTTEDRSSLSTTDGSSGSSAQSGSSFPEGFVFLSDSSDEEEPLVPYETYIRALIHSPVPLWQQRQLEGQQGHLERRRRVESQWFNYREQLDSSAGYRIPPISFDRRAGHTLTQPVVSRPDTSLSRSASASSGTRVSTGTSHYRRARPSINHGESRTFRAVMESLARPPAPISRNASQTTQNRTGDEPTNFLGPFVLLDRQSWPMEAHLLRHMAQILETPEGTTMTVIERHTVCSRFVPSDDGEEDKCPVCLVEFERGDSIRTLRCNHFFHVRCIDRWLVINKKCPVCRLEIDRV